MSLLDKKHFCLMPWTHMHVWPNGKAFMCCIAPQESAIGTLSDTVSIKDLWNSPTMKENRLLMLQDKPIPACNRCYEIEASGGRSQRMDQSKIFAHHLPIVETTQEDGTVDKLNMPYMDIRFSNICNLRCRTCGPELSSRWAADKNKLMKIANTGSGILRPMDEAKLWEQLVELLPTVERIYFAGGEPILTEEHYRILKLLIDNGRTDVMLTYNTNFTMDHFKDLKVFEIWKNFKEVAVGASLDEAGPRAEYIRKELKWDDIERNRKNMKEICPNVSFYINFTLSVFNFSHMPEYHRQVIESGFIEDDQFHINFLTYPTWYRAQITPEDYREGVIKKYEEHIKWLYRNGSPNLHLIAAWNSAINFLRGPQLVDQVPYFKQLTMQLDEIRNESFTETFPEIAFLLD